VLRQILGASVQLSVPIIAVAGYLILRDAGSTGR
jgi:hypothetical protein